MKQNKSPEKVEVLATGRTYEFELRGSIFARNSLTYMLVCAHLNSPSCMRNPGSLFGTGRLLVGTTLRQAFFLYTLEKTQGPKKTQGSRKNSGFCQFSSKLRSKIAILGLLYLIRLQKNSGSRQKNSGFWISC